MFSQFCRDNDESYDQFRIEPNSLQTEMKQHMFL